MGMAFEARLRPRSSPDRLLHPAALLSRLIETRSAFFMVDMVGLNDGSGYTAKSLNPAAVMKLNVPLLYKNSTLTKLSDTVVKAFLAAA